MLHHAARLCVQSTERFVHKQDTRPVDEDTRDLDPLLHAAGKLRRIESLEAGEADQPQNVVRGAMPLTPADAAHFRAERNIFTDALPGKQRMLLEHDAPIRARPHDRLIVDCQPPPRHWQMSRQDAKQGRFPASGWAKHANEFARRDRKVEIADGLEGILPVSERNRDSLDLDPSDRVGRNI
ncbi:hypothetical protein M2222_009082 [Bradyrhizobium elkanii]|nr:hypothetical protein [Bradyrhizobium elkanii]MCS3566760.1 hypothetical protein [Bradyrhizobium elkanii]MCW2152515.1 hypothetical protein [Bradyrhizobium elkanii]MCW2357607.1 hypothetical protein [Bradyrhizobium elkanii]MCW2376246.1 hypothetical protein [Bradyrhizobium elkanii]